MTDTTTTTTLHTDGEHLDMTTRLVVAPVSGTFHPLDALEHAATAEVAPGQVVGHVVSASERTAITSPFGGQIASFLAWRNERVRKYQLLLAVVAS